MTELVMAKPARPNATAVDEDQRAGARVGAIERVRIANVE